MSTQPVEKSATRRLYVCYLLLLVWVPLPLGSNRPWAWAILEFVILMLAAAWLGAYFRGKAKGTSSFKAARPALICAWLWLLYVWLQLVPVPISLLRALSPESAYWHAAACFAADPCLAPLTVDADATLDGALKSSAYVAFFALTLLLLDRRARIVSTCGTLVLSGLTQAVYGGMLALNSGAADDARGSFANRNHFAAYLVICISVGIGLLIGGLKGRESDTFTQSMRHTLGWILSPLMLLRIVLGIMVVALVLTHSRMGNGSFFLSLLLTGIAAAISLKKTAGSMILLIGSLIVIDIAILGAYFGVERVVQRMEQTHGGIEDRGLVADATLAIWAKYPLFGTGLGSYRMAFPRYRTQGIIAPSTHAHNDYLEFASETGILGILLLGFFALTSFWAAARAQFLRSDPLMRGLSFGSIMSICAMALHSTVDFNLQIPANAISFLLVLALSWISLSHGRRGAV